MNKKQETSVKAISTNNIPLKAVSTDTTPLTANSTHEAATGLLPGNPEGTKATVFITTNHSISPATSNPDNGHNVYNVTFKVLRFSRYPVPTGKYLPTEDLLPPSSGSSIPRRVLDSSHTF